VLVEGEPEERRRVALWQLGVAVPGLREPEGTQLALPLEQRSAPALREMTAWERLLADYGSTKVTLREHPLGLMRPDLPEDVLTGAALGRTRSGTGVKVGGIVVARQRPATANGVTFMLLEDETGTINVIIPVPIYERCRAAVRAEPLVLVEGRLERREGVTNVIAANVRRLERPDLPLGEVRHIEPARAWSTDEDGTADLRAVVPAGHSFGRRGR
jgi:error-prone DNA polymerase